MKRIVVIGSASVDYVINVPHLPNEGETVLARGVQTCYGGKGANQAAAIARLGGDVALIGCLGGDEHAPAIVSRLREYGVNIGGIEMVASVPTGAAYINVGDFGETNIVLNPGANNFVSAEVITRRLRMFDGASYCITHLEIPLATVYHIAELCRERNIRLVVDPVPAASLDFYQLNGTWMIIPNESELHAMIPGPDDTPDKAAALLERGFQNVLVTMGEHGGFLLNSSGVYTYPGFHGLAVTDTTAAGDSFLGTLVYSLSKDIEIQRAMSLAAKAAAITVSRRGALQALPSRVEVFEHF